MFRTFALILTLLILLAGCDPLAQVQSSVPPSEDEFARRHLDLIAAEDFAAVEAMMKPDMVDAGLRNTLMEMAAWFPEEAPQEILLVSYGAMEIDGTREF